MNTLAKLWRVVDGVLAFGMRAICLACISGLFLILLGMVLIRFLPVATLSWSSEVMSNTGNRSRLLSGYHSPDRSGSPPPTRYTSPVTTPPTGCGPTTVVV